MFYWFAELVPPNTDKKNYIRRYIDTEEPMLEAIYVQLPSGVCALAGFRVRVADFNIFPRPEGQFFTGDNLSMIFYIDYVFEHVKSRVYVDFYNEDDTYPHRVFVGLLFGTGYRKYSIIPVGGGFYQW